MSTIKELREKYESKKYESDYKHDLKNRNINWRKDIFTVAILLITVFVLFIDKLWRPQGCILFDDMFYFKLIIAISVLIIACLVIWLDKRSNNRIIKDVSEHYVGLKEVLEIFEALADNMSEFSTQVNRLKEAPVVSYLITWENSRKMEVDAIKVWSFSYSLWWLTENNFQRVDDILEELNSKEFESHEYHYILFDPTNEKRQIIKDIRKKIDDFDKLNNCKIAKRFVLQRIIKSTLFFPIPNDIVICQTYAYETNGENKKGKDAIVITTKKEGVENSNNDLGYDILINDEKQVRRVIQWYDNFWDSITQITKDEK